MLPSLNKVNDDDDDDDDDNEDDYYFLLLSLAAGCLFLLRALIGLLRCLFFVIIGQRKRD